MSIRTTQNVWRRRLALGVSLAALVAAPAVTARPSATTTTWYKVSLARLLHPNAPTPNKTYQHSLPPALGPWRYAWKGVQTGSSPTNTMLQLNATSCDRIRLEAGATKLAHSGLPAGHPHLAYYRQGMPEVRQAVHATAVFLFPKVPLPLHHGFVIKVHLQNAGKLADVVYVNGYAYCYTKTGRA